MANLLIIYSYVPEEGQVRLPLLPLAQHATLPGALQAAIRFQRAIQIQNKQVMYNNASMRRHKGICERLPLNAR